jgi:large subunit ribosomal protein L4
MATVDVRSSTGSTVGTIRLDDAVFGVTPNVAVMHQVVTAQLAAARAGTQSTKTRAEVSGGGRKPWRQKGSGRARQGSSRAPHWRGGGIALGPKPRGYRQRTPKKMVQLALHSALSDRASAGKVAVVDAWTFTEPKTKDAKAALRALGLEGQGRVLVVVDREAEAAYKSFRNLPDVQLLLASELNAYDVLCNDWVVFTRATLPGVTSDTAPGGAAVPASASVAASTPAPAGEEPLPSVEPEAPTPASEHDWEAPLRPGFGEQSGDDG